MPFGAVLDLLLPPRCVGCDRPATAALCAPCLAETPALELAEGASTRLGEGVIAVAAYAYRGPVAAAVRAVKVEGRHAPASQLGVLMRARLGLPIEGIPTTWVPSSSRRLRERGFELPRLLAGRGAIPLLRRVADRPDQTTLAPQRRRSSPWGSFAATGQSPPAVVLVDDVRTTGATAAAAASVLRRAGARRVLVATLAAAGAAPDGLLSLGLER